MYQIKWVKVCWHHYLEDDDTWKLEPEMKKLYLHLFDDDMAMSDSPC
jgi:hypothetical protein